ncbi:MAG: ribosome silencing factor [Granulosicoccaceae bacterium]
MTAKITPMQPEALIALVVDALEELKCVDLVNIDVRDKTSVADNMIVCTGTSRRHVVSLAENVVVKAKEAGQAPKGAEGLDSGEWALVDLGDVIVHVMQQATRDLYELEKLWSMAPPSAQANGE